jgi:arsenate reductase
MPMIATDKNQLTLIYNSNSYLGKQVAGYVQGIQKKIDLIDITEQQLKDSIWIELSAMLDMSFEAIFEVQNKEWYKTAQDKEAFNDEDWVKLIHSKPQLLERPIAILGNKAKIISRHSEILEFFGVDSAGLEKIQAHEDPTISSTTENESFLKNPKKE